MVMSRLVLVLVRCSVALWLTALVGFGQDLNTILMRSTFKIEGRLKSGEGKTIGTVFVVGLPLKTAPTRASYVMVTANHVLDNIAGEHATLYLRRKRSDGEYEKEPWKIKIREGTEPLWVRHPEADVAAQYISLPNDADIHLLTTNVLADDKTFERYEIHPGDELNCLGYPHNREANAAGFPILRSGKIASYPLTPAERVKTFLYDFQIYGGNSGGPVYFSQTGRFYGGTYHVGQRIQFIAGLVSSQRVIKEETERILERLNERTVEISIRMYPLFLAHVVPAQFIKETIELLPERSKPSERK